MSALRPADTRGRPPGSQSKFLALSIHVYGTDHPQLLDRCLKIVDPDLYAHLRSKRLSAEIYAFPSVLTLCACTPPLDQVLQLWDFLLAFGVHLNILCVIAQLLLIRDDVIASAS